MIVVQKGGLAWNCRRWLLLDNLISDISLDRPKELVGVVVNDKGNPITGTIVDSEGKPIEQAIVSPMLTGDEWGMNLSANKRILTDRSGRFAIGCVLPDRTCEMSIYAKGYEQVKKEIRTPDDAEKPFDVGRIELVSGADTENRREASSLGYSD